MYDIYRYFNFSKKKIYTSDVITVHIFVANRPNYVATVILIRKLSKRAMKQDCMENTGKKNIIKNKMEYLEIYIGWIVTINIGKINKKLGR